MRSMHCLIGAFLAVAAPAVDGATPEIHLPDGDRPALLCQLGSLEGLTALALGPGGDRAAVAVSPESDPRSATIRLHLSIDTEAETFRMDGRVRDLVFSPDGFRVFGLLHKPAKKTAGETHLLDIDIGRKKARRAMRLPPTATALDYSAATDSLLIACRNEIRTVSLPGLRSGPLYPVPGINSSVASIGGGSLTLVGQSAGLVLVDLSHAPGLKDMPILEKVETEMPVVALAVASDGRRALARLSDGTLMEVTFSPLRARAGGTAVAIATPSRGRPTTTPPTPGGRAPASPPPPPTADPAVPSAEPDRRPAVDVPAESAPPSIPVTVEPDAPPVGDPAAPGTIRGRIVGPAAGNVVEVVVLGPDNILREAARVRPSSDGTWSSQGLAPGRYRIQLDGGGGRVLVSEPAFRLIEIGESIAAPTIEFKVLRSL